jgi:high-affinity Fe2+/Pb2+ permease
MNRINWKALSLWLGIAALVVLTSGVLSYFTADGTAAIGIGIRTIVVNALQWFIALGLSALGAFIFDRQAKPNI